MQHGDTVLRGFSSLKAEVYVGDLRTAKTQEIVGQVLARRWWAQVPRKLLDTGAAMWHPGQRAPVSQLWTWKGVF